VAGPVGATGPQGVAGSAGATGATGPTGSTGANGAAGINFRSAWSSATHYAINDAVTYSGSTYIAIAANNNAEPDVSSTSWSVLAAAGGAGPTGAAATVSVGTVTTLAAGSSATVTNSGTSQSAVLNFGIPQGVTGATGASGSGGSGSGSASGIFTAVFHAVTGSSGMYYAVNSPNVYTNENGTTSTTGVLAWVPLGCTATQLNVYSLQSGTITVTLRTGAPGLMTSSTLVCSSVATNSSCLATGSVVVAPGQFIDYQISGASGTAAPVWTALQCQ